MLPAAQGARGKFTCFGEEEKKRESKKREWEKKMFLWADKCLLGAP